MEEGRREKGEGRNTEGGKLGTLPTFLLKGDRRLLGNPAGMMLLSLAPFGRCGLAIILFLGHSIAFNVLLQLLLKQYAAGLGRCQAE